MSARTDDYRRILITGTRLRPNVSTFLETLAAELDEIRADLREDFMYEMYGSRREARWERAIRRCLDALPD